MDRIAAAAEGGGPSGEQVDGVAIRALPRQGMRFRLRWIALFLIGSQAAAGAVAAITIQWTWRSERDEAPSVTALAASRLRDQRLVPQNLHLTRMLDEVASAAGAHFAAVIDQHDQIIAVSTQAGESVAALKLDPNRSRTREAPVRVQVRPLKSQTMEAALPLTAGAPRYLLLGLPDTSAQRSARDGLLAAAAAAAFALTAPLVLVSIRFRRWTGGLRELHTAIRRLALDCPITPVQVGGDDEIAYLSIAFNDMASRLSANRKALLAANAQLEQRVLERTRELDDANRMLQRQNAKLAEVTETALRFTDDVAHEFRTPLTVISECASATADGLAGAVSDGQAEMLGFVMSASAELSELVDDFLDSSKLRAGTLRINRRACRAGEILDKIWPTLSRRAASAGIELERKDTSELPLLFGDVEKAGRALVNLGVNAIKFSRAGDVVSVEAHCDGDGFVRFSVTDRGPGMSREEASSLFTRFQQTASGRECAAKGFGLGLSIVYDLVSVNLGRVWAESDPGEGSTFAFTIPICEPHAVVSAALQRISQASPSSSVGAILVHAGSASTPKIMQKLARRSRSFDVQIPVLDGSRILVFGPTGDLKCWAARLSAELCGAFGAAFPSANVEPVGVWPIDEARDHLNTLLPDPAPPVAASGCDQQQLIEELVHEPSEENSDRG